MDKHAGATTSKYGGIVEILTLYLLLALQGILGVLVRTGLNKLTAFSGSQYGGLLWSNFTGCLVMGWLVGTQRMFRSHLEVLPGREQAVYAAKTDIPLYVSLATGLCGSVTSLSSYVLEAFEYASHQLLGSSVAGYPNAGYGVAAFLSYTIVTFGVSIVGFCIGKDMAAAFDVVFDRHRFHFARHNVLVERILAVIGLAGWITVIVLAIVETDNGWRVWTLPCSFAPFGVYGRFLLSKVLNKVNKRFPLGTFTANVSATVLLAVLTLLQHGKSPSSSHPLVSTIPSCQVLNGVSSGFCGNLSTVSTFVSELVSLPRRSSYIYFTVTITVCFSCMVLILGVFSWVRGLTSAVC